MQASYRGRSALLVLLLSLAMAAAAWGQAIDPVLERGVAPEKAYQFGDVDAVNMFSGNLSVTIPLGQTYRLSPSLSYRFALSYSGNGWEGDSATYTIDEGDGVLRSYPVDWSYPARDSNAGLGWRLGFGRLDRDVSCSDADVSDTNHFMAYEDPDGATHCSFVTAHPPGVNINELHQQNYSYTRDGSFLRLHDGSGSVADPIYVEFPDGRISYFDVSGRLTKMTDRFGNYMQIVYGMWAGGSKWTVTDSANRIHEVFFKSATKYKELAGLAPFVHEVISKVSLASFKAGD